MSSICRCFSWCRRSGYRQMEKSELSVASSFDSVALEEILEKQSNCCCPCFHRESPAQLPPFQQQDTSSNCFSKIFKCVQRVFCCCSRPEFKSELYEPPNSYQVEHLEHPHNKPGALDMSDTASTGRRKLADQLAAETRGYLSDGSSDEL